jgi:hypothetical protein
MKMLKKSSRISVCTGAVTGAITLLYLAILLLLPLSCAKSPIIPATPPLSPPVPAQPRSRVIVPQSGHHQPIVRAASLPGSELFISSDSSQLRIWQRDGTLLRMIDGLSGGFTLLSGPNAEEQRFAWIEGDGRRIMAATPVGPPELLYYSEHPVDDLAADPSGAVLLLLRYHPSQGFLQCIDSRNGEVLNSLAASPVSAPRFSPDGGLLLLPVQEGLQLYPFSGGAMADNRMEASFLQLPPWSGSGEAVGEILFIDSRRFMLRSAAGHLGAFDIESSRMAKLLWELPDKDTAKVIPEEGGGGFAISHLSRSGVDIYTFPDHDSSVLPLRSPALLRNGVTPLFYPSSDRLYFQPVEMPGAIVAGNPLQQQELFRFPGPGDTMAAALLDEENRCFYHSAGRTLHQRDMAGILRHIFPLPPSSFSGSDAEIVAMVTDGKGTMFLASRGGELMVKAPREELVELLPVQLPENPELLLFNRQTGQLLAASPENSLLVLIGTGSSPEAPDYRIIGSAAGEVKSAASLGFAGFLLSPPQGPARILSPDGSSRPFGPGEVELVMPLLATVSLPHATGDSLLLVFTDPEDPRKLHIGEYQPGSGTLVERGSHKLPWKIHDVFLPPGGRRALLKVEFREDSDPASSVSRGSLLLDLESGQWDNAAPSEASLRLYDAGEEYYLEGSSSRELRISRYGGGSVALFSRGKEWVSWNSEALFAGSREAGAMAGLVEGGQLHRFGQFGPWLNAPDIILQEMDGSDREAVARYRNLRGHRSRSAGLEALSADGAFPLPPEVQLLSSSSSRITDMKYRFSFSARLLPGSAPLSALQIYLNGVPLYGGRGKVLSGAGEQMVEESFELHEEFTRIEIVASDTRGVESPRPVLFGTVRKAKAGEVYYVGFGISSYRDPLPETLYSAKDAVDLRIYFDNVVFDRSFAVDHRAYTDDQLTRETMAEANRYLQGTRPDDTVVLFLAGHTQEMEDENSAGRYFLTADAEPIPWNEVERIFDGIPARRRLLLLDSSLLLPDASGSAFEPAPEPAAEGALLSRGSPIPPGREQDRNRYIHLDAGRPSGAIIFSSRSRGQQSLESVPLRNGLFAEALLQLLTDRASDRNRNGFIDRRELFGPVTDKVLQLSGGLQQPALEQDNPAVPLFLPGISDFGVDIRALLRESDTRFDGASPEPELPAGNKGGRGNDFPQW